MAKTSTRHDICHIAGKDKTLAPEASVKKTIIVITLLLVMSFSLFGLDFSFGIKAGPAIAFGAGAPIPADYVSPQPGFAWSAGIAADLIFADFIVLEINALYAAMYKFGYNADPAINGVGVVQQTLSVSAIEVPLLAKFRLGKGKGKWTIAAGPDFFFLLGQQPKTYFNGVQLGSGLDYENTVLYGIAAAFGYQFPVGEGSLSFELRYTKPLTYFYSAAYNPQGSSASYQRFDLLIGYYFF